MSELQLHQAAWLEENIGTDSLRLDVVDFESYVKSSSFDRSTLYHLLEFGKLRSDISALTRNVSNLSRIVAALGAFIAGANADAIQIADNTVTNVISAGTITRQDQVRNAALIYDFLVEQERLDFLIGARYSIEDAISQGLLSEDISYNPSQNISGEQFAFLFMLKEYESKFKSSLINELSEPELKEFLGIIDFGNLRYVSFTQGVDKAIGQFRDELNWAVTSFSISNADELTDLLHFLELKLSEIKPVTDSLELYNSARVVVKIGVDMADDIARPVLKRILDAADSYRVRRSIDRIIDAVGDLTPSQRSKLEADLINDQALRQLFKEEPGLVDAWKFLDDSGLQLLKTDVNALKFTRKLMTEEAELLSTELVQSNKRLYDNDLLKYVSEISDVEAAAIHKYTVNSMNLNRNCMKALFLVPLSASGLIRYQQG